MPLVDEHVRAVGREVREFAQLHVDLANEEIREASKRFAHGTILISYGILMATLFLVALGMSLYFLLDRWMSHAAAAAVVGLVFLAVGSLAFWLGWRWIGRVSSLTLPRTRAMLWELLTCRDEPTDS